MMNVIKVFILWLAAFLFLIFGLSSQYAYVKAISAVLILVSIITSEKILDIEYVKYHEKKR